MTFHVEILRKAPRRKRNNVWEFRLLYAATFVVMLIPTVFSRLTLEHLGEGHERGSIFHEAGVRADRIVPFMFMG